MAKLLIVDDEEKIRTLIKKYAVFEGYEVVEAANGFEAIAKCASMRFDLILMDIMMPELDGYSAVKEIRKTAQTPVIMLSAKGEEYDRIHGFEIGVDDYVVKPFSVRELMMRIAAIIKRTQGSDLNEFTYKGLKISFSAHLPPVSVAILLISSSCVIRLRSSDSTCIVYPKAPDVRGMIVIFVTGAEFVCNAATNA